MNDLLDTFNRFFEGKAKAVINGNRLEITIDGTTLDISLPEVIGGHSN